MEQQAEPKRPVLILFAHPALEKSRVNRRLADAVRDLDGVTFHDLYEAYPDFHIHVAREQKLLTEHDTLVLQHPFFWYSTPAILKEWQDLVLEHNWAYGSKGTALRGKRVLNAVSTGGREAAYQVGGYNRFTMRQLLSPLEQTFRLCGMEYLPPFVAHGTHGMGPEEIERHAEDYRRLVVALRDDRVRIDGSSDLLRINLDLDAVIDGPQKETPLAR